MACVSENCNKNPFETMDAIVVNCDGDFACNKKCESEYQEQKAKFFSETIHSSEKTEAYLRGD